MGKYIPYTVQHWISPFSTRAIKRTFRNSDMYGFKSKFQNFLEYIILESPSNIEFHLFSSKNEY